MYSKKSFAKHQIEAESLLQQLPFPACFELIETFDDDSTESDDEEMDMIADLIDAYKLELESDVTQADVDSQHKNKSLLELYKLKKTNKHETMNLNK